MEYQRLQSIGQAEFQRLMAACLAQLDAATMSDEADVGRIERMLDLKDGALKGHVLHVQHEYCSGCQRQLTFFDVVHTALVDAGHSKSFLVHTLLGSKYLVDKPRPVRCSACSTVTETYMWYVDSSGYGC